MLTFLIRWFRKPVVEERTSNRGEYLSAVEIREIMRGRRPDCGGGLYVGPEGGGTRNIACDGCGSEFNASGFGGSRNTTRGQPDRERLRMVFGIALAATP